MREPRIVGYALFAVLVTIVIAIAAYAAPLVTIDKPRDREVISGTADIEVSYTADSASPIERVEVYIDSTLVKDYLLEKPQMQGTLRFRWDFTAATPSRHSISARAQDASGAVGATGIKVEVRRTDGVERAPAPGGADRIAPTVDIFYPADGQVVQGEIRVKADVSDNVGVRTVVFFLDGKFKTMIMNSPSYQDRYDTTKMADGPHVVSVSAFDEAENEGTASRTFIVRNHEATTTPTVESAVAVKPDIRLDPVPPPVPDVTPSVPNGATGTVAPVVVNPPPPSVPPPLPPAVTAPARNAMTVGDPTPAVGRLEARESRPGVTVPKAVGLPVAPPPPTRAHTADSTREDRVATASEVLVARVPEGTSAAPRSSTPGTGGLPAPKPVVVPSPPAVTSGMTASLPSRLDAETRVATADAPKDGVSGPRAGQGGALKAVSRPAIQAPASREAVRIAAVIGDGSARAAVPLEAAWRPKTTEVMGTPVVVLAEPTDVPVLPLAAYAATPVGEPRLDRVAMLPHAPDPGAETKVGMPAIDPGKMARFREVKIVFDGKLIPLRAAPEVLSGISLTPLREVFEHCDGQLYWFHQEKRVHAVNPTTDIQLTIGEPTATVNGEQETLVLAPYIKNGRTMVPLEFLAGTLDVTVAFNSATGELIISRNGF